MVIGSLCVLCAVIGWVSGYSLGRKSERKVDKAPVPEYDQQNPINRRGERIVTDEGYVFYRVS